MNGRAIAFVLLSSLIMMAAVILQNKFQPPIVPADPAGEVAAAPDSDVTAQLAEASTSTDEDAPKPDALIPSYPPTEADPEVDSDKKPADAEKIAAADPETSEEVNQVPEVNQEPELELPEAPVDRFVTLGSLAPTSDSRYLITVNQSGGTIHRVELNYRSQPKKRFKYRDLEYNGGYLGCLDCLDTPDGCKVRTVGDGTPAQMAAAVGTQGGIAVDDLLVALNGEPITSVAEFETLLAKKTKPKTVAQLSVKRGDKRITFDVNLFYKPIELIGPEDTRIDPDFDYPESFVLSLLKPSKFVDQAWPDLDRNMRSGRWEVVTPADGNAHQVELRYEIPEKLLTKLDYSGPLTVVKRFSIPKLATDQVNSLDSHSFHFDLEIEIINGSDQAQTVAYELDGPTGTPSETWWYANKIHGRSTAIGYVAGARDVVGSNQQSGFQFLGGPEIVKGVVKKPIKVYYICSPLVPSEANRELNYVGVDAQYFNVSLIPQVPENESFSVDSVTAFTNGGEIPEKDVRLQKLVDVTFQMVKTIELEPGGSYKQTFEIFGGPKEAEVLHHYGLDDTQTFGWFAWCSKPLMWLLHFFYWITGSFSYGLAIIMLTVLVRCCMIPISRKAALNAQMMQHLQPQMKEIADKHKDDMEKRASAQRELFKRNKYNPLGGCFMMFFQLPIFIGLYRGLSVDIALRDQPLIPGMSWCSNLSGPDQFLYWKDWMPAMLANETGWLGPYLNILPLLTMVLFLMQQKLFMPPPTDDQQKMMQKMMTFMMIFMGVMFFKVSAGLCLYFITSSLWGIIERKLLPKPVLVTDNLSGGASGTGVLAGVPPKPPTKAELKAAEDREVELADRKRRNAERNKRLKERGV